MAEFNVKLTRNEIVLLLYCLQTELRDADASVRGELGLIYDKLGLLLVE
ncbi:hypothetical protein [Xanthomonas phage DES1]|nr:hypothetical protein [Xanthomonas phage DES1]